jgi:aminopeptidase N
MADVADLSGLMRSSLVASLAATALLVTVGCQSGSSDGSPGATQTHARPVPKSVAPTPTTARGGAYYPSKGTTSLDALHYGLDLTWAAGTRQLTGTATIRFRATSNESRVSLDFAAPLHASRAELDGHRVRATHPGQKLSVATGRMMRNSRHTLRIRYHGSPRPYAPPKRLADLTGLGWNVQPDGEVWAIQEPFGAYTWYPVDDQPSDKAFYDITWHTQPTWSGVSNGRLMSDKVVGPQRVMHWRLDSPAASYLVTVAIGPYHDYHQTGPHGLPLTYWVRDVDKTSALPVLRQTPAMLRWLEARLGRYPFDSLGDVVVPTHSAEETQTMATIGAPILKTPVARQDLVHEYAHHWYGDEVTPKRWNDLWLNESFAYYIPLRWESAHGVTTTAAWRKTLNQDDQMLRTQYGPPGAYNPVDFAELNVYECGARMLDRLHSMLGDAVFTKVLRGWPRQHRFGNVDRKEWISYLNRTTGRDLRSFVTRWLTSPKSPA